MLENKTSVSRKYFEVSIPHTCSCYSPNMFFFSKHLSYQLGCQTQAWFSVIHMHLFVHRSFLLSSGRWPGFLYNPVMIWYQKQLAVILSSHSFWSPHGLQHFLKKKFLEDFPLKTMFCLWLAIFSHGMGFHHPLIFTNHQLFTLTVWPSAMSLTSSLKRRFRHHDFPPPALSSPGNHHEGDQRHHRLVPQGCWWFVHIARCVIQTKLDDKFQACKTIWDIARLAE